MKAVPLIGRDAELEKLVADWKRLGRPRRDGAGVGEARQREVAAAS